jgi:uncharacterized protein YpmB
MADAEGKVKAEFADADIHNSALGMYQSKPVWQIQFTTKGNKQHYYLIDFFKGEIVKKFDI